ncbi:hypothetical protein [Polycladidibacter hongkongensis]|uniref:hypothetical protein n=1 Tax=Polycladidibacter hongkongensis TaxID=1647556 RepID=UPI00083553A9|nr:hypothetical protein [Pseudovibrio hongkongensis]
MQVDHRHGADFEELDRAAPDLAGRRNLIFGLMGHISYSWSNNESMFIYVMQHLMQSDEITATLVFASLNTTRARIDLVERLANAHLQKKEIAAELRRIIRVFNRLTRLRNEFNHSFFQQDQTGEITHTYSMRIQKKAGVLTLGETKPMDDARIQKMARAINELSELNRDIRSLVPRLQVAMQSSPEAASAS